MGYIIEEIHGTHGRVLSYETQPVMEEHRGWAFGSFLKLDPGQNLDTPFEIKLQSLETGARRDEWSVDDSGVCVTIISEGLMRYWFQFDGEELVIEKGAGDTICWDNTVPHKWEVLETLTYITVRTLK